MTRKMRDQPDQGLVAAEIRRPSSCSGLTRVSPAARQSAQIGAVRVCEDPRIKPEDDEKGRIMPNLVLTLMPVRLRPVATLGSATAALRAAPSPKVDTACGCHDPRAFCRP